MPVITAKATSATLSADATAYGQIIPITCDEYGRMRTVLASAEPITVVVSGTQVFLTSLIDSAGNYIESIQDESGFHHLSTSIIQDVIADSNNSYTTTTSAIAYNGTFTGSGTSTLGVAAIQVSLKTDQKCTVYVEQSPDNTNWDISDEFTYFTTKNFGITTQAINSYVRVRVKNVSPGQVSTSYMRLQTCLCPVAEPIPRALDEDQLLPVCVESIHNDMAEVKISPMGALHTQPAFRLAGAIFTGTTIDTNFWTVLPSNAASAIQANGSLCLSASSTANGTVAASSVRVARYVAGSPNYYRAQVRCPTVTVSTAGHSCTRRWGAYNNNDGAFFELYAVNGSTEVLKVVTRKGGADTPVANGAFNGEEGLTYVVDGNIHTYEIWWTNKKFYFYIDDHLLHTVTGNTATLCNDLHLQIGMQMINAGGNNATNELYCRVASISRLGQLFTESTRAYIHGASSLQVLKRGPGKLHRIVYNGSANGSALSANDSVGTNTGLFAAATFGSQANPQFTEFMAPFFNGLTITTVNAATDVTIIYE